MITPDVERLARQARAQGTPLAVCEFMCRTRPSFTISRFVDECVKLGVRPPASAIACYDVIGQAAKQGLCTRKGIEAISLVAGEVPE